MRKAYMALVLALVISIAWALFMAVTSFPAVEVSADFSRGYILRSWLVNFFDYVPLAIASALVLSFSLLLHPFDFKRNAPLIASLQTLLLVVLAFGVLHTVWYSVLGPRTVIKMAQTRYVSRVAAQALVDAQRSIELERAQEARALLDFFVGLTGRRDDVLDMYARIRELEARDLVDDAPPARSRDLPERAVGPRGAVASNLTPAELIEHAAQFLELREYYSAHYYATLAISMSRIDRPDARRIQSIAWQAIGDGGWAIRGADERELYRRKMEAYQALQQGRSMPERMIESYYLFQALATDAPEDPDVQRYYPEAQRRLSEIAFFIEDAYRYRGYPGLTDMVFVNRRTSTAIEVMSIDQLVQVDAGDFFYGVEVMGVAADGEVMYHLRAPYGKRVGTRLVLRAVPREGQYDPRRLEAGGPVYYAGSREPAEAALFELDVEIDSLVFFASSTTWLAEADIATLAASPAVFSALGLDVGPAHAELTDRFLRLFGYYVVVLLAIGLGWRFRSAYLESPPSMVFLGALVVPFILRYLFESVRYLGRLFVLTAFSTGGSRFGLAALAVVIVVSVALAVTAVLRQRV